MGMCHILFILICVNSYFPLLFAWFTCFYFICFLLGFLRCLFHQISNFIFQYVMFTFSYVFLSFPSNLIVPLPVVALFLSYALKFVLFEFPSWKWIIQFFKKFLGISLGLFICLFTYIICIPFICSVETSVWRVYSH